MSNCRMLVAIAGTERDLQRPRRYITSKIEMLAPLRFAGQPFAISTASSIDPALINE